MFSPEQRRLDARRAALLTGVAFLAAVVVFLGLRLTGEDFVVDARGVDQSVPVGAVVVAPSSAASRHTCWLVWPYPPPGRDEPLSG